MLGNRTEDDLAARAVLARHQAEPSGHLPSVFKLTAIADLADQGGRHQRPHARDALQCALARQSLAGLPNLRFQILDQVIHFFQSME